MLHFATRSLLQLGAILSLAFTSHAQSDESETALVISVADQRMALLRGGELVHKYPISTSKFGLGDSYGSYRTPLGRMRVFEKHGDGLPIGAVLKGRNATGEILQVNAPGRDPIVTRILWLEGTEPHNRNARARGIYIHGTPEESRLGEPVSWGCIRMRSSDVADLFDTVSVGTPVLITEERLPRWPRYRPDRTLLVANSPEFNLLSPIAEGAHRASTRRRMNSEMLASLGTPLPRASGAIARAMNGSILLAGLDVTEDGDDTPESQNEAVDPASPAALLTSGLLNDTAGSELQLATGVVGSGFGDAFTLALLETDPVGENDAPAFLWETEAAAFQLVE